MIAAAEADGQAVDQLGSGDNQRTETPAPDELIAAREGATLFDIAGAVTRARHEQLSVQAARHRRAGAERAAEARLAFARPQVGVTATYDHVDGIFNSRAFLPGAEDPDEAWAGSVNARQLIYGFGARSAAGGLGRGDIALAEAELQLTERDVAYRTRSTIGRVWHGRARVDIALARARLREDELRDADQLFAAGRIAAIDVRQSEISLIQAQDQLAAERSALTQLAEDLSLLLALPADAIAISGELQRVDDFDRLLAAAHAAATGNSDVAALEAAMQSQGALVDSLNTAYMPQLYAVGRAGLDGSELEDLDDGYSLGVELSWRFDGGGNLQRKAQARESIIALEADRRLAADGNLARITQLATEIASLERRIAEQRRAVTLAEQNYTDTRELYNAGRVTLTRVTEANFFVTQARFLLTDLIFQENLIAFELQRLAE